MPRTLSSMLGTALVGFALLPACHTVQNAAAQDPQKCERDPKCNHKQDKSRDCITSCVDNIDCISRCDQVNEQNR